ncbi:hypothetical protein H310_00565 [Aphanomyces invadans]|uniref:RING-type domain-containing protein n=1 Tax=Aphanomyces invadans TaxID=157072 RepID=A0A024UUK3_9STRA|nr:hypothetical protein H310_00565 [Aphanomyces invadans]ETW10201.1 hypothetical protein H310_00565 [Aphanomyces invadans]|eukprot:XP_008861612.1 hypothetical protein H310_00565 [Aphanomyces invadans]
MARMAPYRMKIPDLVKERVAQTLAMTMYLVQTTGPTNYVIQEQNSDRKHRVLIGSVQSCSCGDKEICCHLLFVMLKILRVPASNPVIWQRSLIDSETNMVLTGGYSQADGGGVRKPFLRRKVDEASPETGSDGLGKECARHTVVEGEVCAICREDMVEAQQNLTYCKRGCGNNFHIDCMKILGESRKQAKENIICPLCRQDWGDSALTNLKKEADVSNRNPLVHIGASCKQCLTKPIRCQRYRCLQCKHVDLCEKCFKSNAHAKHSFVVRKAHKGTWFPALRTIRSSLLSPEAINDLEGRELSNADYDMLMELDAAEKYPLQDYLMANLAGKEITDTKAWAPERVDGITWCTVCQQSLRMAASIRSLPCQHTFHASCLLQHLLSQKYTCPNAPTCDHILFPGLHHVADGKKSVAHAMSSSVSTATPSAGSAAALPALFSVVPLIKRSDGTVLPLDCPMSKKALEKGKAVKKPHAPPPLLPMNNQLEVDVALTGLHQPHPRQEQQRPGQPQRPRKLPTHLRHPCPQPNLALLEPAFVVGSLATTSHPPSRLNSLPKLSPVLSPTSARLAQAEAARQLVRTQSQERKRQQAQAVHDRKQALNQLTTSPLEGRIVLPPLCVGSGGHASSNQDQNSIVDKTIKAKKAERVARHEQVKARREQLHAIPHSAIAGLNML